MAKRPLGWTVFRLTLAALLLAAAVLKVVQFGSGPPPGPPGKGWLDSPWLTLIVVQTELAVCAWLVSGLWQVAASRVVLVLFAGFALVSIAKIVAQETSCGCFGRLRVSPWVTAVLDVFVVVALALWRPRTGDGTQRPVRGRGVVALAAVWVILATAAGWVFLTSSHARLADDGLIDQEHGLVVLEPETWTGKRLPLAPYIRGVDGLDQGKWVVLLYHHSCPQCEATVRDLSEKVKSGQIDGRVALIELPPYAPPGRHPANCPGCRFGQVDRSRDWFAETPVVLELLDGVVTKVTTRDQLSREAATR